MKIPTKTHRFFKGKRAGGALYKDPQLDLTVLESPNPHLPWLCWWMSEWLPLPMYKDFDRKPFLVSGYNNNAAKSDGDIQS